MTKSISAEDRIAINDLLMEYAWANDSADVELLVSLFTADAVLMLSDGHRYENSDGIRRFATEHGSQPGRAGRQHLVQQVLFKPRAEGCAVRSYWMVIQALVATNSKFIRAVGYYDDIVVKAGGRWLLKSRTMGGWNDQTKPPARL